MLPGQVMVPGPLWVRTCLVGFPIQPSSISFLAFFHTARVGLSQTVDVVCGGEEWNGGRVGGWVKASCGGGTLRMGNSTLGEPRRCGGCPSTSTCLKVEMTEGEGAAVPNPKEAELPRLYSWHLQ